MSNLDLALSFYIAAIYGLETAALFHLVLGVVGLIFKGIIAAYFGSKKK